MCYCALLSLPCRRPVRSIINQINLLIDEFLLSNNAEEALRCLKELEVPHFHHEVVVVVVRVVVVDDDDHDDDHDVHVPVCV